MTLHSCFPRGYSVSGHRLGPRKFLISLPGRCKLSAASLLCAAILAATGYAQQASSASPRPDASTLPSETPLPTTTQGDSSSAVEATLPDAPDPAQSSAQDSPPNKPSQSPSDSSQPQQTKRILGIIPNFRSVNADVKLPPQSVKEKFLTATDDSFDYSSIFIPALLAAYSLGTNATPEFGHGAVGYGRYFWHAAVDQTSENYMVEFIVPVIAREDTRYYTLGHGGFLKRAGYSLSRAVITRADSGKETFNFSEVVGAGASSGISSFYYPSRERSIGNTGKEWGLDVGIDAASFMVKEFWPDINRHIFHQSN
jgi:hypothetical protein